MSAILGTFQTDGQAADAVALERMLAVLRHRGPDGASRWRDGPVALGYQSFRTIEACADQPLVRAVGEGTLALVADARIDNRDEILGAAGLSRSNPVSDEELILEAYERWGEACPERLVGDFAFALWDGRERKLFCARDPIGARALYYHLGPARFVFATEIKGVRAHGGIGDELDEEKVADYLGQVSADRTRTFFRSIRRLAPGHALRVSRSGSRTWRYWGLDPAAELRLPDDDAYAERFLELFAEALACRMRTPRRLGVLLSGGLDSSAMVCLARQRRDEWGQTPLTVLSARFPDFPHIDEGSFIDEVVAGGGVEPHSVSAGARTPLGEVEAVLACQDQPFHSPNLFVYWSLAQRARELGISVMLDGIDGDTTVSHGVEWLGELLRRGRWLRAVTEARALARNFRRRTRQFLWHFGVRPGFVEPWRYRVASLFGGGVPGPPRTVSREFAQRVGWQERLRTLLGAELSPPTTLREHHRRALTSDLIPHFLEVDDLASGAFGLEPRHPYFDTRLVEFCFATPPDQKLAGGWDRAVQRRAMAGVVPDRIRWRTTKSHWGDQFKTGFLHGDRDRIRDVLAAPGELRRFVDVAELTAAWDRCASGRGPADDIMNLWLAVLLGHWLRQGRIPAGDQLAGGAPAARIPDG